MPTDLSQIRCLMCKKWSRDKDPLNFNPDYPEYHGLGTCSDPHFIALSEETNPRGRIKGTLVCGGYEGYGDSFNTHEDFGCKYFEVDK